MSTPCTTCSQFCDTTVCEDECDGTPGCLEYAIVFQTSGDPDPSVAAACDALLDSNARCGQPVGSDDVDCNRLARFYDSVTAAPALRCLEQLPCDATFAAAYACFPRPSHGLAEWYCRETVRHDAASCDVAVRDRIARFDGWVLDSAAEALRECGTFEVQGVSFEECVGSWLTTVALF